MKLGGREHRLWLWWWELPGSHWWFPYTVLGHEMIWSVNDGGPVAWPGRIRCRFRPHSDDGYDGCVYCGAYGWNLRKVKLVPVDESEDHW